MAFESLPPKPTIDQLRHVANNYPIIDNHAHNLLLPSHIDTIPFESITSEAQGRALRDTFKSLAHLRAARQLRQLYECPEDADWQEILDQRTEWLNSDPERLYRKCFQGIYSILIDDGLADVDKVYPYSWHDKYTTAPCKRIIRIETVAETLMERILQDASISDLDKPSYLTDTWLTFTDEFEREIQEAIQDVDVAGFKSVVCYRTGLDIEPDYEEAAREVGHPFERYVDRCVRKKKYKIERKALNDYLVLRTLEILSEQLPHSDSFSKPLQLHTGLGDHDISLRESNPAFLQPLIENYPWVPFVLLHSAYPYTREAGYLATVYRHVYLDLGEVFPMVNRDGQKSILRQALEIVPGSKLMYSTDGHFFPETYWLANKQFREAWLELLIEYVEKDDITPFQAIGMTKDVLFHNSNVLYDLRFEVVFKDMIEPAQKSLTFGTKPDITSQQIPPVSGPQSIPMIFPPPTNSAGMASRPPNVSNQEKSGPVAKYQPLPFPPPPKVAQVYEIQYFDDFMKQHSDIKFVYVQWLDYMATVRARIIPIKEFERMVREGDRIGISQGNTGTLQNDSITPAVNPVGQIYVEPDLRSLRRTHRKEPVPSATVLCFWRNEAGRPIRECPRASLEALISDLQYKHGINLLCGFEIEITFLARNASNKEQPYAPLTHNHAWGTLTPEQWLQLPLLTDIATGLQDIGIDVQQFHAESGPGQFEFVLGPQPPLTAVDTLIQARQVITQIASLHDLRATLHPQVFPGVGTAAHAHISINPPDKDMEFFVAGVLWHLPAICAFAMPEASSYTRVTDNSWTGGTWLAWGTQNRETPLRRVKDGRWEVRSLDGFANMYFALGAIIASGLLGLKGQVSELMEKDCPYNPALLTEEQRTSYGITSKMPSSVEEALERLGKDEELTEVLAEGLVSDYLAMKQSEQKMLGNMSEAERRVWLIERY
ncbi:developmental protein-like protein fluG [Pleomassaria siparia CBS 279.74]|uniref:Glutamine synthetase n=1 Tax=Pleomassaria siparia CBS 279.74 TaxID=1314801 RepID=A0A6G1JQX7_9PLEO|nr:developmental protein-like protein fluG [Pleomassaria siparia CBS 279.74]